MIVKKFISFLTAFCFSIFAVNLQSFYPSGNYESFISYADEQNDTDWRKLYGEILEKAINSENYSAKDSMFDLFDINDDNIPELFISNNTSKDTGCDIYTVFNGSAVCLGNRGYYGELRFNNIKGVLLSDSSLNGLKTYTFTKLDNESLDDVLVASDNVYTFSNISSLNPEQVEFTINGEKTTYENYASALGEYDIKNNKYNWYYFNSYANHYYIETGRRYKLTKDVVNSVLNERGWKSAYANILRNTNKKYFSLCNIDDNDVPELVLHSSQGMSYHSDCSIEICME